MKKFLYLSLFLLLGACAYQNPLSDMAFQTTPAPPYIIANWYKIEQPGAVLKVYIEGDGFTPDSDNPTPNGEFMRNLSANDSSQNVAYVARPCQYLQVGCSRADWTIDQYSDQVVDSMSDTVAALMKKAKAKQVILIGFAGGAQIATQIAVRHPKWVKQVITITPLYNSENDDESLKNIPHTHYIGDMEYTPNLFGKVITVPKAKYDTGFDSIYRDIYEAE